MTAGKIIRGIDGIFSLTSGATTEELPCLMSWTLESSASVTEENATCMASNDDGGSAVGPALE